MLILHDSVANKSLDIYGEEKPGFFLLTEDLSAATSRAIV